MLVIATAPFRERIEAHQQYSNLTPVIASGAHRSMWETTLAKARNTEFISMAVGVAYRNPKTSLVIPSQTYCIRLEFELCGSTATYKVEMSPSKNRALLARLRWFSVSLAKNKSLSFRVSSVFNLVSSFCSTYREMLFLLFGRSSGLHELYP